MRPSRLAAIAASLIVVPGAAGCGSDGAPDGPFGTDRDEIVQAVQASAKADAANDARAVCGLMTTTVQRYYISGFADDAPRGPRDTDACARAYRKLEDRFERAADAGTVTRIRASRSRIGAAARDDGNLDVSFHDGLVDVVVDAAPGEDDDGYFRVERDDDRWRIGMYPETATLR